MLFGGVRAVADLHFSAPPAAVTSLIGPNGAGKTTALNMLGGFYTPTAGGFTLGTQALAGRSALHIARAGIARTYQTSQLFGSLSVLDNVVLAMHRGRLGPLLGAHRRSDPARCARAAALLAWCGYAGRADATWRPTCRMWTGAWWRSPVRWPPTPRPCCWTSRPPACRARTRHSWPRCCAASPTPASRCCWSNTT